VIIQWNLRTSSQILAGFDYYHSYVTSSTETIEPEVVTGGVRKRKIKVMPKHFFPWEQEEDDFIEEVIKDLKRPILKIVKRAPQPDFDSTLEGERLNQEIIKELKRVEKIRKKKAQRRKAIEMLLLS